LDRSLFRSRLAKEFIEDATSPKSSLLRRKSPGSPQPVEIERMLIERRKELEEHMDMLDGRRSAVEAAKGLLRETVVDYLSK